MSHIQSTFCGAFKTPTVVTSPHSVAAEAAAVRLSDPAGFGPEGGPGIQGGAYTGDLNDSMCFSPPPRQYLHTYIRV